MSGLEEMVAFDFTYNCVSCRRVVTVRNGQSLPHTCRRRLHPFVVLELALGACAVAMAAADYWLRSDGYEDS